MAEVWKDITGYEGRYQVSDMGNVRNAHGHILSPNNNGNGYLVVHLYIKGRATRKAFTIHSLVLHAFVSPRPSEDTVTRHLNGNRGDNRLVNICYGTYEENHQDKIIHGTGGKGDLAPSKKIRGVDVLKIRELKGQFSQSQLGAMFGVHKSNISSIHRRKSWKHI